MSRDKCEFIRFFKPQSPILGVFYLESTPQRTLEHFVLMSLFIRLTSKNIICSSCHFLYTCFLKQLNYRSTSTKEEMFPPDSTKQCGSVVSRQDHCSASDEEDDEPSGSWSNHSEGRGTPPTSSSMVFHCCFNSRKAVDPILDGITSLLVEGEEGEERDAGVGSESCLAFFPIAYFPFFS